MSFLACLYTIDPHCHKTTSGSLSSANKRVWYTFLIISMAPFDEQSCIFYFFLFFLQQQRKKVDWVSQKYIDSPLIYFTCPHGLGIYVVQLLRNLFKRWFLVFQWYLMIDVPFTKIFSWRGFCELLFNVFLNVSILHPSYSIELISWSFFKAI